ncbi:MAG: recombination protein RecR [Clostridia bacterium]|nr:recombination protein RecR [Clostridia bacterium]
MASEHLEPLERLSDMFRRLDGVGKKSAMRYAFCVLNFTEEEARAFADAILAAKTDIHQCSRCQNITTGDICPICSDDRRDSGVVCVVEDPRAVIAIEKTRQYGGLYHVLHGTISPARGITPDRLKIRELLTRLQTEEVREIILATNPTVEGEATAMYIAKLLAPLGIQVSRIANGVPVGGDLEYADEVTLRRAMEGRYLL